MEDPLKISAITRARFLKFRPAATTATVTALWAILFALMVVSPKFGGTPHTLKSCIIAAFELAVILSLSGWVICKTKLQWVVVAGMSLVSGLILAMLIASPTKKSVHPDEFSHLGAYDYYVDHLLPPSVDDPATIPSTSVWGYSYLFELDVVYDIAARMTGQLRKFTFDNLLACRLFQFGLWAALCFIAMYHRRWAGVLCVTLFSPQIWYVFSYFNADAFPLTLTLIAAGIVSDEEGGLGRFLGTGNVRNPALWVAAVCIGLTLVSKVNYLPVLLVFLLWLSVTHLGLRWQTVVLEMMGALLIGTGMFMKSVPALTGWYMPLALTGLVAAGTGFLFFVWRCWTDGGKRRVFVRLVSFTLLCILIAAPRVVWDIHVNGWPSQKAERIHAVVEARAGPEFKPSVIAQGTGFPTIDLAARGVSLFNVAFSPYNWTSTSLASAFGVYGYMNIFAPRWLYWLLYITAGLLISLLLYSLWKNVPEQWIALTAVVFGGAVLVLASSLLLSWTSALQAQGRYLFAILPMIALLLGTRQAQLPGRTLAFLVGAAFVCSAGSFAFVALPALAG